MKDYSTLNAKELHVLRSVARHAMDNGGDFAISDEIKVDGMGRQALGAYLTDLSKKGFFEIHEPHKVNDDDWVTQITFPSVEGYTDYKGIEELAEGPSNPSWTGSLDSEGADQLAAVLSFYEAQGRLFAGRQGTRKAGEAMIEEAITLRGQLGLGNR